MAMDSKALLAALATMLLVPACDQREPAAAKPTTRTASAGDNCARGADHQRLKAIAFEKAAEIRAGDDALLARLAQDAAARIDGPAVTARDDALNVTLCKGRMVIDLPPGVADAFSGERRLVANVTYAVQAAADGTRRFSRFEGADPIIYRLAAIGLTGDAQLAARSPEPVVDAPIEVERPRLAALPPARAPRRDVRAVPEPQGQTARAPRLAATERPSYDCRLARSVPDRIVCADERLAALDRVTVSFYREAMDNTDAETRAILRGTASDFAARRASCRQPACIARAYEDRMDEIDRIAVVD